MKRKTETEIQFLRRVWRTRNKSVKNGGPTTAEIARACQIKLQQRAKATGND